MKQWIGMAAMAAALVCSGCGGGGGSSGGNGNVNPAPPDSGSGLVPMPPTPGQVLVAKATDVRPVIAGAEWTFHAHDYVGMGPAQVKTTATSTIANGVIEVDSDDPSTNVSVTVDAASGSVSMAVDVSLGSKLAALRIDGFELRSPVRLNDQYVLLDRHLADLGTDVDGDNKPDALDIAVWRVVEGQETLTPPRGVAISTVRVDTFVAARITPSGGGAAQTATQRQSTWYAAGIGAIRKVSYSSTPGLTYDYESWLTGFDGVTSGWGVVVQPGQFAGTPIQATGPAFAAVRNAEGVLAMTTSYLVQLDKTGRITKATPYSTAGIGFDGGVIVSTTAGLRYLRSSDPSDVRISALRDDGTLDTSHAVVHLDLATYNPVGAFLQLRAFTIAPGGDRFWMGWTRTTVSAGTSHDDLLVRAFDPDGVPIGPEIALPTSQGVGPIVVMQATPSNGLIATWTEYGSGYGASAQSRIDSDGSVLWTAREDTSNTLGGAPCCMFSLFDEGSTWLTWRAAFTGAPDQAHGVRVDAAGRFVGVTTDASAFASESLAALDASFLVGWSQQFTAIQGHFHATAKVFSAPYPDDTRQFNHLEYAEFDATPGNLAAGMKQVRRAVVDGLVTPPQVPPIVFDDRVLLLTDNGSTLQPTLIWR